MFIDNYKTVVMQENGYPGNIGDSCAETGRVVHLKALLKDGTVQYDLYAFIIPEGFTRHPTAPEKGALEPKADGSPSDSWRNPSMTTDQMLPLYVAGDAGLKNLIKLRIEADGWRTGNGDLVSPVFYAILKEWYWLVDLSTIAQALAFKLPYRWNEARWKRGENPFESNTESSGDYLNYIHAAIYANKYARKFVSKETLKAKVRHYYRNEPNHDELIALYDQVIDNFF